MTIRELPDANPRVETGATRFGDDWPGLFIRGDNAFFYALQLHGVITKLAAHPTIKVADLIEMSALIDLYKALKDTQIGDPVLPEL